MTGYTTIVPAAYLPNDDGWKKTFQAIIFPSSWTKPLLALHRHDRFDPSRYKSVPTRRLSQLMRALFPQIVSTGRDITADDASPWLYLHAGGDAPAKPVPPDLITAAIVSWVHTINPQADADGLRQDVIDRILTTPLTWQPATVDLFQHDVTAGGTAQPQPAAYHLLPDSIAANLLQLEPFELGNERIHFLRTPTPRGAELVSWPPRQAHDDGAAGFFSIYLAITLQTVPFSNNVRVHLHCGTRRWVTRPNRIARGRRATVYMLTDMPWMDGVPLSPGFSSSTVGWDHSAGEYGWRIGGPEGMLQRLTLSRDFPTPADLLETPDAWLSGVNGVIAAVTHHTTMGSHPAGAGLMPADRAPLMDWANTAFAAHLHPVQPLTKSPLSGRVLAPPTPPAGSDDDAKKAWRQGQKTAAGHEQRQRLAQHLAGSDATRSPMQRLRLDIDLMVPSTKLRDGLKRAIMTDLALDEPDTSANGSWHWALDAFDLRVHQVFLGPLGDKLTTSRKGRKDHARQQIVERREAVRTHLAHGGTPSTAAIVELIDEFDDSFSDPKHAIRLGCAAAGRVTQFMTPPKPREGAQAFEERMLAVWRDCMRQLGVRAVPQHTLDQQVPADIQYVGLWMIKRRADGPTYRAQHVPVAVLISPSQPTVRGTAAGLPDWVDYRTLLLHLADEGSKPVLEKPPDRQATMAMFVKRLTAQLRNTTTLLVTHAQNSRAGWPWLQNGVVVADRVGLGNNPPVALQHLAGRGLRVVRVRDSSARETPQWYSPGHTAPGLATGLWRDASLGGADARTFFSTMPKPGTMKTVAVSASKIISRVNRKGDEQIDASVQAHNPQLLELTVVAQQPGDSAEVWAALAHQQRQTPDYRAALANPLCLHLARLASDYLLPHDADEASDNTLAEDSEPAPPDIAELGDVNDVNEEE
jgi:pPIWI_RE module N-terminal domain/RNaseH domain of pPIWI_RE/MID domain of pPIWI_RE